MPWLFFAFLIIIANILRISNILLCVTHVLWTLYKLPSLTQYLFETCNCFMNWSCHVCFKGRLCIYGAYRYYQDITLFLSYDTFQAGFLRGYSNDQKYRISNDDFLSHSQISENFLGIYFFNHNFSSLKTL